MNYEDLETFLVVRKRLAKETVKEGLVQIRNIEKWLKRKNLTYTTRAIEQYLYELREKGLRASTINTYFTQLKRLEEYFIDRGLNEPFLNGIGYLDQERQPVIIFTTDEIRSILDTIVPYKPVHMGHDTSGLDELYKTYWKLLALTGCREGEAINLKVKYVSTDSVMFTETKTKEFRRVAIMPDLYNSIKPYLLNKDENDYVFKSSWGTPLLPQNLFLDLKRRAKMVGITKRVYPHLFRHSFITHMITRGIPITIVATIVGHKKIDTTNWYTHLADETIKQAIYKHPLVQGSVPINELFKSIVEALKSYQLQEDTRFVYKLEETSKSLIFSISV